MNNLNYCRNLILCFFIFTLSCECKKEFIEPSKIVELSSKEINALNNANFIVDKIRGATEVKEKLIGLKDNEFNFKKDGTIISENKKIGSWGTNRWVYIDGIETKFLINFVSSYKMRIYAHYTLCDSDSIIEESIHLKNTNIDHLKETEGLDF